MRCAASSRICRIQRPKPSRLERSGGPSMIPLRLLSASRNRGRLVVETRRPFLALARGETVRRDCSFMAERSYSLVSKSRAGRVRNGAGPDHTPEPKERAEGAACDCDDPGWRNGQGSESGVVLLSSQTHQALDWASESRAWRTACWSFLARAARAAV